LEVRAPVVPEQAAGAVEYGREYPFFSRAGIIMPPIAAHVAAEAPDTASNIWDDATVTIGKPERL